jgi:hypothetical protein
MIRNLPTLLLVTSLATSLVANADSIQDLKFTDVVKDVVVMDATTKKVTPAKVGDTVTPPNVIKTGPDSRAELVAADNTVTRVGANTLFSVQPNSRDVNLTQGSVLFHSPRGRGGGNIKGAGATCSVLGTTLIVGANPTGGFKVMLLEGKGQVSGAAGSSAKLSAGQMTFAMPGKPLSQPMNFELKGQVSGSKLVGGFSKPVASIAKIEAAIATQQAQISGGQLASTGLLIGDNPTSAFKVDASSLQPFVNQTLQRIQFVQSPVPSRSVLDPRYAIALANGPLNILTPAPSPENAEKFAQHAFTIDIKTGINSEGYGNPSTVQGGRDREGTPYEGGIISVLLGTEVNISTPNPDSYLLVAPFEEKNYFGIVALKDINILDDLQLPHPAEEGSAKLLLLSAGRTLNLAPGKYLSSGTNVDVFDIYTEGTEFSSNTKDLKTFLTPVAAGDSPKVGLTLLSLDQNQVPQRSQRIENPTIGGLLRISSPSVQLDNVDLFSRTTGGVLQVEARDGDLQIGTAVLAALERTDSDTSSPTDPEADSDELRPNLIASNLLLRAKGSLQLLGADVATNSLELLSTDGALKISGALFNGASLADSVDFSYTAKFSAKESILIENTAFRGAPTLTLDSKSSTFGNADLDVHSQLEIQLLNTFDLPLGFDNPTQLASDATSVKIRSSASTVRLGGIFLVAGNQDLTLSNLTLSDRSPGATEGLPEDTSVEIVAKNAAVTIKESSISHDLSIDSLKNSVLLDDVAFQNTNTVSVLAETDVTFKNVSVASTKPNSKVTIVSRDGDVVLDGAVVVDGRLTHSARHGDRVVDGRKLIQSKTVTIVSRVALNPDGTPSEQFTGKNDLKGNITVQNHSIKADVVQMSARDQIKLNNVTFNQMTEAQKVNLAARTTVLKDVTFAEGSMLNFKVSGVEGNQVAGNVGYRSTVVPGLLNVLSNVYYGTHHIAIKGDDNVHMTGTAFTTALEAQGLSNASQKIKVTTTTR